MSSSVEIIDHFMYTKEHEWINIEDGIGIMGVTEYAQNALGDVTYVELPVEDSEVEQFEQFVSVESVKAVSEVFTPIAGEVAEVNDGINDTPEAVNNDPYNGGWMIKVKMDNPGEADGLLSSAEYEEYLRRYPARLMGLGVRPEHVTPFIRDGRG